MKLSIVLSVLASFLFLNLVESRNHFLTDPKVKRTTLVAPTATPGKSLPVNGAPKRTTLAAPTPSTISSNKESKSDFSLAGLGKMLENFMKKLFSAGKSDGVAEAARTTVRPAGI